MEVHKPRLCFVGPMLGKNPGWVLSQGEILAEMLAQEGYRVKLVSTIPNRFLRMLDTLKSLIAWRNQIDVIILMVFSGPAFIFAEVASFIAKRLSKPLILWVHGGNLPDFAKRCPLRVKRVLSRGDVLVAPSEYLAQFFRGKGANCEIISNILQLEKYTYRQRDTIKPYILWMRAFHGIYDPRTAIDIFEKVQQRYPDARLTMAGQDRGLLTSIKRLVKQKGLKEHIRFTGFLDTKKKQEEFSRNDIFLNTSRIDNMPVGLLEAAAFGLPIVTTRAGGIPYVFEHEKTALSVDDGDAAGASEAVQRLLKEPKLTQCLSYNGRALGERCDWLKVKPQWENLFKRLLMHG